MQKADKKPPVIITAGISLLFVVFITLCLVVFALLTFSTAKAGKNLSEKKVQGITEYYKACSSANNTVAEIDRTLKAMAGSELEYGDGIIEIGELQEAFKGQSKIMVSDSGDDAFPKLSFSEMINDSKRIEITLLLTDASYGKLSERTENHYYTVKSWQTVVTAEWSEDEAAIPLSGQNDQGSYVR